MGRGGYMLGIMFSAQNVIDVSTVVALSYHMELYIVSMLSLNRTLS